MTERWQRERELFEAALDLDQEERETYLERQCEDSDLFERLRDMLAAHDATAEQGGGHAKAPASRDHPERIGPYRILEAVGEGGMGTVFLAEQTKPVRRRVALKIIKAGMATKEVIARFESERQALALMNHPNIAGILDAGETDDGRPYFVLEYVGGVSIVDYCDTRKLGITERLRLFLDVCGAVEHAHQKGVIHRDIKPSNILVMEGEDGALVKVIDFGIAKATNQRLSDLTVHTRLGSFIGTPEYMSPEQSELSPLDVDTRADVYSLGAVLYKLLVGVAPLVFESDWSMPEIQRTVAEGDPPSPSTRLGKMGEPAQQEAKRRSTDVDTLKRRLYGDLDWITFKALEKDRNRRYSFASELAEDIRRHLDHRPVLAGPPSTAYRVQKFVRRHRAGVLAGAVALALVAIGLWGMWGWWRAARSAELAQRFGQDVAGLQWQLRVAEMMPLHDLTPEHRRMEQRLDQIGDETQALGSVADAPGEYALGRGKLALGRFDDALVHLDEAWSAGLHTPDVAFARGVALGRVYSREYGKARAIRDPDRRERQVAEVRERFRDPALEALADARSTAAAPLAYVEALIALYEERYDEALDGAEAALEDAPWFWEAHNLRGHVHNELAGKAFPAGRRSEGYAELAAAEAAYDQASTIAPSAPGPYRGQCSNGNYRLFQSLYERLSDDEFAHIRAKTKAACGRLAEVFPEHPELGGALANMHLMTAQRLVAQGKDPRAELEQARALARAEVEREPDSARALKALADSMLVLGRYGWDRGEDTRDLLEEAAQTFGRAAELQPSVAAHNNAANALLLKSRLESARNIDPTGTLARAEELYRQAAELNPTDVLTKGNIVLAMRDRAEWESAHGTDPRARLVEALELLELQLERAPDNWFLHTTMAGLARDMAQAEAFWGDDEPLAQVLLKAPTLLERGREAARRSIELSPDTHRPYWSMAQVEAEATRQQVASMRDPKPTADAARAALDRYLELFPDQAKAYRVRGRIEVELARYEHLHGRDPGAWLDAASEALDKALRLQPSEETEVLPIRAEVMLMRVDAAPTDAAARRLLPEAVDLAGRVEAKMPDDAEALLFAAFLRVAERRLATRPQQRDEAAAAAAALFDRAVEINRALAVNVEHGRRELARDQ